jgi:hypothetical protein
MIDEVIKEMMRKIAGESIKINDLALNKSMDIIIKALKAQRGFKNADKDVKNILQKQ